MVNKPLSNSNKAVNSMRRRDKKRAREFYSLIDRWENKYTNLIIEGEWERDSNIEVEVRHKDHFADVIFSFIMYYSIVDNKWVMYPSTGGKFRKSLGWILREINNSVPAEVYSPIETKAKEDYLFKVARRTLEWAGVDYKEEELADLVMQGLFNIKGREAGDVVKVSADKTGQELLKGLLMIGR